MPLATLLNTVLTGVQQALPGELGTAVSIAHPDLSRGGGQLQVLAATGIGRILPPITTGHLWGPSLLVAAGEEPIVTDDLWHDARWPHLALDTVLPQVDEIHHDTLRRVRGAAAMPSVWADDGVAVVSAYLDRPADAATLAVLERFERLVTSAVTIAEVAGRRLDETDHVLDALASRALIEQAKGAIMTVRHCDADEAWSILRRASQEFNIKLRGLALALIEHISDSTASQPDATRTIQADPETRAAAAEVWNAMTDHRTQRSVN